MRHRPRTVPLAFVTLIGLQCSAPEAAAPPTHAVPACAELSGPQCLPRASCGCFGEECIAGRVEPVNGGADRFVADGALESDGMAQLIEVCPNALNGLAECFTYVEVAQTCTVVCSDPPDHFSDPGYRCGFVDGACTRLGGPSLAPAVPAADPAAYADVRDAAAWLNPYLIVRADGVEIRSNGTIRVVAADALAEALVALPASAWPYGRVVAVQEQSIRSAGGSDDAAIGSNKEKCESELRRLGVVANWWPSG